LRNGAAKGNITEWFDEIDKGQLPNAEIKMGWLKIAFNYSFYYLKHADNFRDEKDFFTTKIKQILLEGGDTDTNAAIVGGMIGGLVGFKNIPPY